MNAHRVRLIVFLVLVTFMTVGPISDIVVGLDGNRAWRMFAGAGWGVIDARFTQLLNDGTEVVLDRLKLLEGTYKHQTTLERRRNNVWLMREENGGELDVAKQLCGVLGPGARIKIDSRISTPKGWTPNLTGKIVDCSEQ